MRNYTQLAREERYQIYVLKGAGHKQSEIAEMLGRHKSTISRELWRNRGGRGYRPKQAHRVALARRQAKARARLSQGDWVLIEALIRQDWSPEQIAGRLWEERRLQISHEWIYLHIYEDKASGGTLHRHLRCRKKRRKRYGSYERRGTIPGRVFIDERPPIVESRRRRGDWEGDTLIGKRHRGALLSLVERKSSYTLIERVSRKTAAEVRKAILQRLEPHRDRVHTLTFDNGREFSDHQGIAEDLRARVYFAHPYASWERGLNENTNGLIRQYFPKHRNLKTVSDDEINRATNRLNHRPRKKLGFKTPHEVFFNMRTQLTVALQS